MDPARVHSQLPSSEAAEMIAPPAPIPSSLPTSINSTAAPISGQQLARSPPSQPPPTTHPTGGPAPPAHLAAYSQSSATAPAATTTRASRAPSLSSTSSPLYSAASAYRSSIGSSSGVLPFGSGPRSSRSYYVAGQLVTPSARPSTGSTVASYASALPHFDGARPSPPVSPTTPVVALPAVGSQRPSEDRPRYSLDTATSGPQSAHGSPSVSRASSSSARTSGAGGRIGKSFDAALASNETYVLGDADPAARSINDGGASPLVVSRSSLVDESALSESEGPAQAASPRSSISSTARRGTPRSSRRGRSRSDSTRSHRSRIINAAATKAPWQDNDYAASGGASGSARSSADHTRHGGGAGGPTSIVTAPTDEPAGVDPDKTPMLLQSETVAAQYADAGPSALADYTRAQLDTLRPERLNLRSSISSSTSGHQHSMNGRGSGPTSPQSAVAPSRPPRAVERSPSTSTRASSNSGARRYATPPSGGASPVLVVEPLPAVGQGASGYSSDVPLHPLQSNGSRNPTATTSPQHPRSDGLQPQPKLTRSYLRASGTASSPDLKGRIAHEMAASKPQPPLPNVLIPPGGGSGQGVGGLSPSTPDSVATAQLPFPKSPVAAAPNARKSLEARSAAAPRLGLASGQVATSLAQEVAGSSPDPDKASGSSNFFTQRMKKTSGFLKKFRGADAGLSSNGGLGVPPPSARLSRRASNGEIGHDGNGQGPTNYAAEQGLGNSPAMAGVPNVPTIPAKYAKESVSSSRGLLGRKKRAKDSASGGEIGLGIGNVPSSAARGPVRAGSVPVEGGTMMTAGGTIIPQRSASYAPDSMSMTPSASAASTHSRASSNTAGGSISSGSELRHALATWSSEMDDALKSSAQDLETKTQIAPPRGTWRPSPQLPEFEGIGGLGGKVRSGSFMGDEEEDAKAGAVGGRVAQQTPVLRGGSGWGSEYSSPGGPWASPNGGRSEPATPRLAEAPRGRDRLGPQPPLLRSISGGGPPSVSSASVTADAAPSRKPAADAQATNASSREAGRSSLSPTTPTFGSGNRASSHLSRTENSSVRSARSFETAIDPGSAFFSRTSNKDSTEPGSNDAPSKKDTASTAPSESGPAAEEAEEALDPEKSIRLVPKRGASADATQGNILDPATFSAPASADAQARPGEDDATRGGHDRDVSGLGPLPAINVARRGSKGSVQSFGSGAQLSVGLVTPSSRLPSPALRMPDAPPSGLQTLLADEDMTVEEKAKVASQKCWDEDESFMRKEKIAEWLGGIGSINKAALPHYFSHFDFSGMRIDAAFRRLCDKLFLRAETQQVDRILHAFSKRFWEGNPNSLYGSADVVHSVVFSLLLLNTDLHVADMAERMTRNQFVRNTLSAIVESRALDAPVAPKAPGPSSDSRSSISMPDDVAGRSSLASRPGGKPERTGTMGSNASASLNTSQDAAPGPSDKRQPSISSSAQGSAPEATRSKAWEVELEAQLKEMYAAVKADQIRLPGSGGDRDSLSPLLSSQRRPMKGNAVNLLKRGSIRGIQGLLGTGAALQRSEESLSLTPSSAGARSIGSESWLGGTSASSVLSSPTSQLAAPSLGFASTLSHTIIKETQDEDDTQSIASVPDDIDDDELALMGPPWAKEGVLTRKHYWEAPQRRSKDKSWVEVFVVVQKGTLSMFRFGESSSSSSSKGGPVGGGSGGVVGGGNWLSNATALGEFPLAHTLANALPPPGYNRQRPHVFALTLPSGAVYFFQAGHEELVQEWVSTCNYWAARQSKEPLAAGVSNMEYGWNKVLPRSDSDEEDEVLADDMSGSPQLPDGSTYNRRPSISNDAQSVRSGRSGRSLRNRNARSMFQNWNDAASLVAPNNGNGSSGMGSSIYNGISSPGGPRSAAASIMSGGGGRSAPAHSNERIHIHTWLPPPMPTATSSLKEEEQLEAVQRYLARVEAQLEEHNGLRESMVNLYSPRGQNHARALANWSAKSNHLLSQLTKCQVYVEALKSSAKLKAEKMADREVESMMRRADHELARTKVEEEGGPVIMSGGGAQT